MHKNRSTTPCLGICTTTFGDQVCKGCKRFSHEIVGWTRFSLEERAFVNDRLEKFKLMVLKNRFRIDDVDLFAIKLKENAISYNNSLDPLTWIFDLLRAAGSQSLDLTQFGISVLKYYEPEKIKDELNQELLELSEAHHQRYFSSK